MESKKIEYECNINLHFQPNIFLEKKKRPEEKPTDREGNTHPQLVRPIHFVFPPKSGFGSA